MVDNRFAIAADRIIDGKIVWTHEEVALHHDFKRLANGNVVFPVWKE